MAKGFSYIFEFKDGQIAWCEHCELHINNAEDGMKDFEKYHGRFGDKMIAWRMSDGWGHNADKATILLPLTPEREKVLKHFNYI